ncbi:unnamed protein product [Anisakis simplex]|uniref:non-specific serine/threonine protein kinase n=1 Tax=Anisakis simplex TaxID=6269 RepID=A0A0M3K6K2_ANISI|nr:unnamed protein product [Anisakis simplex]
MVNLRTRRNRPRLTIRGVMTVIDDVADDCNDYVENKQVWAELGLGSEEDDEYAGEDFHLTHYWEAPDERRKQKRINKRKNEKAIDEPDLSASAFPDAHYRSLLADINSAENYSLVIEGVNDSPAGGAVVPSKSVSSIESQRQQSSIATHYQARDPTDVPPLPDRCSFPSPSLSCSSRSGSSSEIAPIIMELDGTASEAANRTSQQLDRLSVERRTASSSTENDHLNRSAKSVPVQPVMDQTSSLHDQISVLRDVTSASTNVSFYQKSQKLNVVDESDQMQFSSEEIIRGTLRPSLRTSELLPFATSTPLRPDVALSSQFASLRSQYDSPLAVHQPSHSQIDISSSSQQKQDDNEISAETSLTENTLWRSTSLHNNSIIRTSAYWKLAEVERSKRLTMFPDDRPNEREDTSRNLSIYEEDPDRAPFFLNEFNEWSKKYARARDFKREVLFLCGQKAPIQWTSIKKFLNISSAKKLGEGTYGEVFSATCNGKETAVKIIPIDGSTLLADGQRQNEYAEVQLEIVVSKELSELAVEDGGYSTEGFIKLLNCCITKGKYPKKLLSAWDSYANERDSYNLNPEAFPASQCYCVLAFELGGRDLEVYDVRSIEVAYSIMVQIITALAVAEDRLQYEHRDLHVGNVLVSEGSDHQLRTELISSQKVQIKMCGVSVKIIDFTLSRLKKGRTTIFRELANEEDLFTGEGDLQFDIYRLMKKANRNNWAVFNPKTNIMWLVYLSRFIHQKMVENVVGAEDERERFLRLFQSLHRFGLFISLFAV